MSVENPGGKRWWRGGYVCECVTLIYPIMERRAQEAGVATPADVYQYCYNAGGVSASAGTHDLGGVTDHNQWSDDQLRIQRECGGAAWFRTPAEGFDYHTHIVLIGCPHLSSGAADQVVDYRNGRNGLANNGPDTGPDVPYITWQDAYYKYVDQVGGDDVPDVIKGQRSNDQEISGDDWRALYIDNTSKNFSYLSGPVDAYQVTAALQVVGLAVGKALQVRFRMVKDYSGDKDTVVESSYPIHEIIGTDGDAYGIVTWSGDLGDKDSDGGTRKLRLYAKTPNGVQVTIADHTWRVLSWS